MKNDNLIRILGIESLPDEQKARILDQVSSAVEQRLLIRLMDSLTPDKAAELKSILDRGEDRIESFVSENAPDFPAWVEEETNRIKNELHGLGKE